MQKVRQGKAALSTFPFRSKDRNVLNMLVEGATELSVDRKGDF